MRQNKRQYYAVPKQENNVLTPFNNRAVAACFHIPLRCELADWRITVNPRFPELRNFFFEWFLPEALQHERQRRQRLAKQRHKNARRRHRKGRIVEGAARLREFGV